MKTFQIREKFTTFVTLEADSLEAAKAKWLAYDYREQVGDLSAPARVIIHLLNRKDNRNPDVREVPESELQAEREALDRDNPAPKEMP